MDFSWSTPLRQNGQTNLPLIPNEIYLVIFEHIVPKSEPVPLEHIDTFSALTFVCRFFRAVALPRVFECVVFSSSHRTRRTWVKQILANNEPAKSVALYVKECHFTTKCYHSQDISFSFSKPFCQTMACMLNLRKVQFNKLIIEKEHWETMTGLKQLECLTFADCYFAEDPPDQELNVHTLRYFGSPTSIVLRPIATSTLRTLETDNLKVTLNLIATRQLAIKNFIYHARSLYHNDELLPLVFERLPCLESVTVTTHQAAFLLGLIGDLSLKRLFTRLRSFTVVGRSGPPEQDVDKLLSAICDGPGTLPSLTELNLMIESYTSGEYQRIHDIVFNRLESWIKPAFPNVKYVRTPSRDWSIDD